MKIWEGIQKIVKGERPLIDVWHYWLGNYRYKFWYGGKWSKKSQLIANIRKSVIRKHIKEQIEYRIKWMDRECYDNGSCKICGCETTALQMSNKPCDKPCYPAMMNKGQWKKYQKGGTFRDKNGIWIKIFTEDGKPILIKETSYGYYTF